MHVYIAPEPGNPVMHVYIAPEPGNPVMHVYIAPEPGNPVMHVYIAPEPGNPVLSCCTVLLSPTRTCFHPAHISTRKGAYKACCHYRRKALLKHIAIPSCEVLIFMDK